MVSFPRFHIKPSQDGYLFRRQLGVPHSPFEWNLAVISINPYALYVHADVVAPRVNTAREPECSIVRAS